jgi:hypothetical protein
LKLPVCLPGVELWHTAAIFWPNRADKDAAGTNSNVFAKQKRKAPKRHVLGSSFSGVLRSKTPKAKAAGFRQRKG